MSPKATAALVLALAVAVLVLRKAAKSRGYSDLSVRRARSRRRPTRNTRVPAQKR